MNVSTSINEALAFHEAGHAVVALALGLRLRSVGIRLEQGNGYCRDTLRDCILTGDMMSGADWRWAHQKALILLGGEAAERVYYLGEGDVPFCSQHDEVELAELCCSAFGGLGPKASQWIQKCRDETANIVMTTANWKGICALAELLLLYNHLSGEIAERAIRGGHNIFWP